MKSRGFSKKSRIFVLIILIPVFQGTSSNFWQAWRGMEQYRLSEEERSRATADLPPPYNLIKSIATHDITEPPPSYPGSRHSNSTTSINQQEETTTSKLLIIHELSCHSETNNRGCSPIHRYCVDNFRSGI